MKRCPSCQQMFPDNAPAQCPYDGTYLVNDAPPQQQYYGGGPPPPPPYGQPGDPSQWQPPGGEYYQQQPGGAYPPPPAYGGPYAPSAPAGGLSKAALFTGIGALGAFIIAIVVAMIGYSGGMGTMRDLLPIIGILGLLALLAGLTSVILGIVVLSQASRNPGASKVHGILGIIFGAIPIILWLIGMANGGRRF
jgi:hypothetical protein